MKNILSVCAFFASLWNAPFMGQFQDSLNEDQTIVRIWEGDN